MKELFAQQLDKVLAQAEGCAGLACEGPLRVGAATLSRTDMDDVTATTVLGAVAPNERELLEALVAEIADEFDLDACVSLGAASFSVRFSRLSEPLKRAHPIGAASPRSAWARIVSGLF
jgi:hypothetical protein